MKNRLRCIRFLPMGAELLKSAVSLLVLGSGISAVAVLFGVTLNPDATLPIVLSAGLKTDFSGDDALRHWLRIPWMTAKAFFIVFALQCMAFGFVTIMAMFFFREQTFSLLANITQAETIYLTRMMSIDFWMPMGGLFCAFFTVALVLNKYVEPKEAI